MKVDRTAYQREYKRRKAAEKKAIKLLPQLGTLSPAMRNLAQFDPIIANRLRRERGEEPIPINLNQYNTGR